MTRARPWTSFYSAEKHAPVLFSIGWFPCFLAALVWACLAYLRRRLPSFGYRPSVPAVCVGNLTLGGSGKTPLVLSLAQAWQASRPTLISRGYRGRRESDGGKVDTGHPDGAREYGDEPWMLAHRTGAPVYVGRRRDESVKVAESIERPGVLVFDDGFQNRRVRYDKTILIWDPSPREEGRYCFPLGQLREPLGAAACADMTVALKDGPELPEGRPHRRLRAESEGPFGETGAPHLPRGAGYGAFCGIGSPEGFLTPLRDRGWLVHEETFPDHYWYTPADIDALNRIGKERQLEGWLTTEKDWFRLGQLRNRVELPVYWSRLTVSLGRDFLTQLEVPGV